jgi:hypothetical protein
MDDKNFKLLGTLLIEAWLVICNGQSFPGAIWSLLLVGENGKCR